MGKLEDVDIVFDAPFAVFHTDDIVSGDLMFNLKEAQRAQALNLNVRGEGHVKFSDSGSGGSFSRDHSNHETYLDETISLWGDDSKAESSDYLAVGHHKFRFRVQLPSELPTTFESLHGSVKYTATVHLILSPDKTETHSKEFTVISHHDLNKVPLAKDSYHEQLEKSQCCLAMTSGTFGASFRLPKRGWVPGDAIGASAEIENNTRRDCIAELKIVMETTYRGKSKTRVEKQTVARIAHVTPPGCKEHWEDPLGVPPLPPSGLKNCGIIDIAYYLQFKLQPRGFGWEELVFQPEIVIGTIPLIDPRRSPRSGSSRENLNVDLTQVSAMFPKVGEHEQDEEKDEEKASETNKGD